MSETFNTPDTPTVQTATATAPAPATHAASYQTPRVFLGAAWVAIVAGIVFILSVIFFTGMALAHHGGHHRGFHHHTHHAAMWMHPHRFGGPGSPGGPGGPGAHLPGAPGSVTPGTPGPGQIPSSVVPTQTP